MRTATVHIMDDIDLDTLVRKELGIMNYEFVPVQECGNGESFLFQIDEEHNEWSLKEIEKWKSGSFVHYSNAAILTELCALGHIQPGEYLIQVGY